jgi:uncharacterized protein (DUF2384 family)
MNDWLSEILDYFGNCEDTADWLQEPAAELDGRTPLEAVRDGDQSLVAQWVEALTD